MAGSASNEVSRCTTREKGGIHALLKLGLFSSMVHGEGIQDEVGELPGGRGFHDLRTSRLVMSPVSHWGMEQTVMAIKEMGQRARE
jgi:hypothetical protein